MISNLSVLMAQKAQRENRKITLRAVERDTKLSYYTLRKFDDNTLEEFPKHFLQTLVTYFDCGPGDLWIIRDTPATTD